MSDGEELGARRRARALERDAARARDAAGELDRLADEVAGRLDPVLARTGPEVWAGVAADRAADAAGSARLDLAVAATSLREVAQDLRVHAATLSWRAEGLHSRPDGTGAGAPR